MQRTARRELRGFQVEGHGLHSWYFPVIFYVANLILNVPCLKLQSLMGLLFWKVHKIIILLALDNLIIFYSWWNSVKYNWLSIEENKWIMVRIYFSFNFSFLQHSPWKMFVIPYSCRFLFLENLSCCFLLSNTITT